MDGELEHVRPGVVAGDVEPEARAVEDAGLDLGAEDVSSSRAGPAISFLSGSTMALSLHGTGAQGTSLAQPRIGERRPAVYTLLPVHSSATGA